MKFRGKVASNDSRPNRKEAVKDSKDLAAAETKGKKKRSRGRRRKGKSRNNKQEQPQQQQQQQHKNKQQQQQQQQQQSSSNANSKKHHDAPMKKRDLYFCMTCAMVAVKGGGSVVARVTIVNWDMEMVLDTFVHVPVPVSDFGDSGVTPSDIRKSITNVKAKSFAQVRQEVEKLLCGKILIGHHLAEKLTALGLTHPITDVRDTSTFFGDADIRELSEVLLHKELPTPDKTDFPIQYCCAALDLYKTHRKEWEEDLIQQAQERQKQILLQQQQQHQQRTPPPPQRYHYRPERHNHHHTMDHHNSNNSPHMMRAYHSNQQPIMSQQQQRQPHSMPQDNASWFVRGANVPVSSQPQSTPALSSRAMQALSSYSQHSSHYGDESYESMSYDGSSMIDSSSMDHSSSIFGSSSHVSGSVGTASVASWQQESQEEKQESNSSSWFRFGSSSKKNPLASPYRGNMERVCEEPEDDLVDELQLQLHFPKLATGASQDIVEDERGREKSWFAFRRSKSPTHSATTTSTVVDELDHSRSHAARELAIHLSNTANDNNNNNINTLYTDHQIPLKLDEKLEAVAAAEQAPPIPMPNAASKDERSSSWFSKIRRAKSPTISKMAAPVEAIATTIESGTVEPTESTYAENDEDWLQEVMDKKIPARSSNGSIGIEEQEETEEEPSKSTLFRFLRSPRQHKQTNRSRLPSLENEFSSEELRELQQLEPGESSFDEDIDGWVGDLDPANLSDADSNWTDTIFAARPRIATESTIPSIAASEDYLEEDIMMSGLIGMEQNLAFLNI
ncbi:MAG: hypothetical protein SGBAC_004870 [Bacillariaceae sp.]